MAREKYSLGFYTPRLVLMMREITLNGERDLNKVADKIGRTPKFTYTLASRYNIVLENTEDREVAVRRRPDLDTLISEGASLGELARAFSQSEQNIARYIKLSRQYESWVKKRGDNYGRRRETGERAQ